MNEKEGIAKELHRSARKRFPTRNYELKGIHDLYEADLVEMIPYSKENGNFKYIMTVINCFSKFAYAIPLKSKNADEVVNAIEPILRSNKMKHLHTDGGKEWFNSKFAILMKRYNVNHYTTYSGKKAAFVERFNRTLKGVMWRNKMKHLHTDGGKEWFNSKFAILMKRYNVNHYTTYSGKKAAFVERFNRTLKGEMWRKFTERGSHRWFDILDGLVNKYNDTVHTTIKMKPKNVTNKNEGEVMCNISSSRKNRQYIFKPKFKKGDKVRISKYKKIFDKGYLPNWTNEIFTVSKVMYTSPITYKLVDDRNEEIKGGFYTEELQKTKYGGLLS